MGIKDLQMDHACRRMSAVLVCVAVLLTSCKHSRKSELTRDDLVGVWRSTDNKVTAITFQSDNRFAIKGLPSVLFGSSPLPERQYREGTIWGGTLINASGTWQITQSDLIDRYGVVRLRPKATGDLGVWSELALEVQSNDEGLVVSIPIGDPDSDAGLSFRKDKPSNPR